jgi:hypothetical protein
VPSRLYNRSEARTLSARYCYSVFLRHLIMLDRVGAPTDPRVVAEIGPGASIGAGLAALLAGAETYYGFDIKAYHHGPRTRPCADRGPPRPGAGTRAGGAPAPGPDRGRRRPGLADLATPGAFMIARPEARS